MASCSEKLTSSERKRNEYGPMLEYEYQSEFPGQAGKCVIKSVYNKHCPEHNSFRELPNAARSVFFPGFPTMKHLKYKVKFIRQYIKIFFF